MEIRQHSGLFTLQTEQTLPLSILEAWNFFSNPKNLLKITPDHLGFEITSDVPEEIYPGCLITYKVSPFLGIKTNWVTEITQVKTGRYFIDEQRYGPYSMWHHEHFFFETKNGVLMKDKITYKVPGGLIGRALHPIIVLPRLKQIFSYRSEVLPKLLG